MTRQGQQVTAIPVVHHLPARARFTDEGLMVRLGRLLEDARLGDLIRKKGDLVAIKIDVGDLGGLSYLRPPLVRAVVEQVLGLGGDPVLMDTMRLNSDARSLGYGWMEAAMVSGYTDVTLGRPLTLGDGYTGEEGELLPVDGDELGGVDVARALTEYAALIILSHVTGHPFAGLSGALAGLGLGGTSQRGKWRIHAPLEPEVDPRQCDGCGLCVERCLHEAISLDDELARIDGERCRGCAYYCTAACPHDALAVAADGIGRFQKGVVEAASAVHVAAQGNMHFLSFLTDVGPYPDYYPYSDVAVVPDLGVLSGRDPVAIDQAALDLIDGAPGIAGSAADDAGSLEPGEGKLSRITGADPAFMLGYAQDYGLGSRRHEVEIIGVSAGSAP